MPLAVGDTCNQGHKILSSTQLGSAGRSKRGTPLIRCMDCDKDRKKRKRLGLPPVGRRLLDLKPGKTCPKGHKLLSWDDLSVAKTSHKTGKKNWRCRACLREEARDRRASGYNPKLTQLQRGKCNKGHKLSSMDDIVMLGTRQFCRQCDYEAASVLTEDRFVELECSHQPLYSAPFPAPQDIIFCMKCDMYRVVRGLGRASRKSTVTEPVSNDL